MSLEKIFKVQITKNYTIHAADSVEAQKLAEKKLAKELSENHKLRDIFRFYLWSRN